MGIKPGHVWPGVPRPHQSLELGHSLFPWCCLVSRATLYDPICHVTWRVTLVSQTLSTYLLIVIKMSMKKLNSFDGLLLSPLNQPFSLCVYSFGIYWSFTSFDCKLPLMGPEQGHRNISTSQAIQPDPKLVARFDLWNEILWGLRAGALTSKSFHMLSCVLSWHIHIHLPILANFTNENVTHLWLYWKPRTYWRLVI